MAMSQSVLPREGCSKLFKTFDVALKKSERHLVLSTTYGLNISWSKKITVGLRLRIDGTFEPVIRLINNYSSGVSLSVSAWEDLMESFELIDTYFEKGNTKSENKLYDLTNDTIALDNSMMRFTTAHGNRVVAFYTKNTGVQEAADDEDEEEPGPAKKSKTYTPVIVMQKGTFDGLKNIACCINARLTRLESLMKDVNIVKDAMVKYFASVLVLRKMKSPTLQQIGALVCDESDSTREVVGMQCDTNFRDMYFDIVFSELLRLFLAYIIADVRQSVLTESSVKDV